MTTTTALILLSIILTIFSILLIAKILRQRKKGISLKNQLATESYNFEDDDSLFI